MPIVPRTPPTGLPKKPVPGTPKPDNAVKARKSPLDLSYQDILYKTYPQ